MNQLRQLADACQGVLQGESCHFSGLSTDTRQIRAGDVYVALKGHRFDGHEFVEQAANQGAVALVVDHPMLQVALPQIIVRDTTSSLGQIGAAYRNAFKGQLIGITGSGGKTTVKGMLQQILSHVGSTIATRGNLNNHIGVPLTLMRLRQQKFAVVEMGTSQPGEISYLTSLVMPDIALVNNVMPAHIGGFGSLDAIAKEKGAIYSQLKPLQMAVINGDDDYAGDWIAQTKGVQQLIYSVKEEAAAGANVVAERVLADEFGCYNFQLRYDHESVDVALAVLGKHMVANAVAAASCAIAAGCSLQDISMGLAKYQGEKGRMQSLRGVRGSCLIDDTYNANLGSVKAAIDYLSGCSGERFLVLGNLGELGVEVERTHREIGQYAKLSGIHALFAVGEHARYAVLEFGQGAISYENKAELIQALHQKLNDQVTVLFKGSRSSRMEEVCAGLIDVEESKTC